MNPIIYKVVVRPDGHAPVSYLVQLETEALRTRCEKDGHPTDFENPKIEYNHHWQGVVDEACTTHAYGLHLVSHGGEADFSYERNDLLIRIPDAQPLSAPYIQHDGFVIKHIGCEE